MDMGKELGGQRPTWATQLAPCSRTTNPVGICLWNELAFTCPDKLPTPPFPSPQKGTQSTGNTMLPTPLPNMDGDGETPLRDLDSTAASPLECSS